MHYLKLALFLGINVLTLTGCAEQRAMWGKPSEGLTPPVLNPITVMNRSLRDLPPARNKVVIAVYDFTDKTGKMKASDTVQTLSRAVTQGGTAVLIKALQDAGNGSWFTVVERKTLDNLLRERRIISDNRRIYLGEKGINTRALPPLLSAGILLDGGVIGYDTNTRTGGAGARYLGIGGDVKYREHIVSVSLRAVRTKTGEVLNSVIAHKTVISVGIQGHVFKYVSLYKILESEVGFTKNEPDQIAVQQAVEKAVHTLIIDGADRGLWSFHDRKAQERLVAEYHREQFGRAPKSRLQRQTKTKLVELDGSK
jgi:curli production assembly/transport component CsgG